MMLSRTLKTVVVIVAVSGLSVAAAGTAGAEPGREHVHHREQFPMGRGHHSGTSTCTGTFAAPGVLAGTYHSDVVVDGVCVVNGGPATIHGDLIVAPGGALNASFALNDQPGGSGTSSLTVKRDVVVQAGAVLFMGCEPNFSPCSDDPDQNGGTLTGQNHVHGSVVAFGALGVIMHASTIDDNVFELGGGGGVNCTPPPGSVFEAFGSPAFSDYEDNSIGGDLAVLGLQTCWMGSLRNTVGGSIADIGNTAADPDAGEVLQNTVHGDIACFANSPSVQFGDSGASPNIVSGDAFGECGFDVLSPDPNYPNGDGTGGPQPISIKAAHHEHHHHRTTDARKVNGRPRPTFRVIRLAPNIRSGTVRNFV